MITPNQAISHLLVLAFTLTLCHSSGEACTNAEGAETGAACGEEDGARFHRHHEAPGHGEGGRMVQIQRMTCEDGAVARWNSPDRGVVTYKVNNWAGVDLETALAVRRGGVAVGAGAAVLCHARNRRR